MLKTLIHSKFTYWIALLYFIAFGWWIYLQSVDRSSAYWFYAYYSLIALSGGVYGVILSFKKWGGLKSVLGRGLFFLSIGLLTQCFGLLAYTYYNIILKVEIPYPSLADIGYFSTIPAYSYAAYNFARASGAKFSLASARGKLQVLLIPGAVLIFAYLLFLKNIGFDLTTPLKTLLDFGYPLGQTIPISLALLTLTLSRNLLGGVMRNRIWLLIGGFALQFLSEYSFAYSVATETFIDAGIVDLLYITAYMIMSLGIIGLSDLE